MNKIILLFVFLILLFAFIANPAPISIEMADLFLIALSMLVGALSILTTANFNVDATEANLLSAIIFYLSYLLISSLVGLSHGVSLLNCLRSLGPYINFFPIILLGFLPQKVVNPWKIALIFIMIGLLQASYHLYLYYSSLNNRLDTLSVLRSRITLIEPRTTLPIILSTTILPMVFLWYENYFLKALAFMFIFFGLLAGAATLTRSLIIAIFIGWITFIILSLRQQMNQKQFSLTKLMHRLLFYGFALSCLLFLLMLLPKIQLLLSGLIARFNYHPTTHHADYTNGRLYEEWLPALYTWLASGPIGLFFGIGAGNTFQTISGEERSYIHNLLIYSLVYGGIFGFLSVIWLYVTLFKTLVIRAHQSQQLIYIGFAALLISIFSYAQLFAVHKGLAFNAMLFLIIAIALNRPQKRLDS